MRKVLKNKPLIEAIFEAHWALKEQIGDFKVDPHYTILLGRMFDRVQDNYPFHEQLATANIPIEIAGRVVQQRFRAKEGGWPLVQFGPGVCTLNDTDSYDWEKSFRPGIADLIQKLFEAYPRPEDLQIENLILRYIDAIIVDFEKENVFDFLRTKMKVNVDIQENVFEKTGITRRPEVLDLRFAFHSQTPAGSLQLRFAKGNREGKDALIWETVFSSSGEDAPKDIKSIIAWADNAHQITSNCFFEIIDGELLRRFE
ncbi:TIGR04255 family protein [Candidatus Chloroploca sp. Khr17]|uniref:TIGR04255 family protein n=1 Tax=Candidatus Chloroploca sp. Khr17 TaxID=2496869 RepID=UPI00101C51FF|nr:TIGR04255 family protein [Candidatus Chloroploca sp. Khr17]